jgi:hypothetical protein
MAPTEVFPEVFSYELLGLPLKERLKSLYIYIMSGTTPVAQTPYRMAPIELVELKVQLQKLLDKRCIRPSNST